MALTIEQIDQYFEKSERLNLLQRRTKEFLTMLLRNHEEQILRYYNFTDRVGLNVPGKEEGEVINFKYVVRQKPLPYEQKYEASISITINGQTYCYDASSFVPSSIIERLYANLPIIVNTINKSAPPSYQVKVDQMVHDFLNL
jgi:hypothetical protein